MKYILIIIICLVSVQIAFSQTYKLEVEYLNFLLASHEKTPQEAGDMKRALDAACDGSKNYPVLPYDSITKTFNFKYVLSCPGVPKKVIFRRLKEWCALAYADVDAALRYEDLESGKLITKGYTPITYKKTFQGWFGLRRTYAQTNKCYHTLIFTCIDDKIKLEIQEIRYSFVTGGYYTGLNNVYVPKNETEIFLNTMFPIIDNDQREWAGLLDLARQTVFAYGEHAKALNNYILDWEKDYKF